VSDTIKEILTNLTSSEWIERTQAYNELLTLTSISDLTNLEREVQAKDNFVIDKSFIAHLELLSKRTNDIEKLSLIIKLILKYFTHSSKQISLEAKRILDQILTSPEVTRGVKIESIRQSWEILDLQSRIHLCKKIGQYKVVQLTPLILKSLADEKNEFLLLNSLTALMNISAGRGRREVQRLIKHDNPEISLLAIQVLGKIGNTFDVSSISPFLYSDNPEFVLKAVVAYAKLKGTRSPKKLQQIYLSTDDPEIKTTILQQLGRIDHKRAAHTLLSLYKKENNQQLRSKIEWALHNINNEILINSVILFFKLSSEKIKYKLITLCAEIYHPKCMRFLMKVIKNEKNDFLRLSAIESISTYQDDRVISLLESFVEDYNDPLSYYALSSLMRHLKSDFNLYLERFIDFNVPEKSMHHQLVLSILAEHAINEEISKKVYSYISSMLSSSSQNNIFLAIKATASFYTEDTIQKVLGVFQGHCTDNLRDQAAQTLVTILTNAPKNLDNLTQLIHSEEFMQILGGSTLQYDLVHEFFIQQRKLNFPAKKLLPLKNSITPYLSDLLEDQNLINGILNFLDCSDIILTSAQLDLLVEYYSFFTDSYEKNLTLEIIGRHHNEDYRNFLINNGLREKRYDTIRKYIGGLV